MSCESLLFSIVSGNVVLNQLEPYTLPLCMLLLLSACCKCQCVAKHSASWQRCTPVQSIVMAHMGTSLTYMTYLQTISSPQSCLSAQTNRRCQALRSHHTITLMLIKFARKCGFWFGKTEREVEHQPKQMSNALLQLPKFDNIHTLSVSRSAINAITFNKAGDWVALGCAALGQLLVWEWRSESYILKQQGHYYDIATSAFSPDGQNLATGADDSKVSTSDQSNQNHAVVHLDVRTMVLMPSSMQSASTNTTT